MNTKGKDSSQASESSSLDLLIQQWIDQHLSFERYSLALFIPFKILGRFHVDPQSKLGKSMVFIFCIIIFLGLPLATTAVLDQWALAPIDDWIIITIIFGLMIGIGYNLYYQIALKVCSIGHAVIDKDAVRRQITWDKFWFNLRISGTVGAIALAAMLASLIYINRQRIGAVIPGGNLLVIGFLSYQIGEFGFNTLMICFEARNFAEMEHALFRFNPLDTYNLHRAIIGYNQFGLVTSLVMTIFIASSGILLPDSAYLANPVWLFLLLAGYLVVILAVILPRYYIQKIVRDAKRKELVPIRQKIDFMFDHLTTLSQEEHDEMLRMINIQDMISKAPESSLPFSTIGRLFGTLLLPTITLIVSTFGEAYISKLIQP
jgi:hypothetical protein